MMAEHVDNSQHVVQQLLTRLDEISASISPRERDAEVRRVFTGRRTTSEDNVASLSGPSTQRLPSGSTVSRQRPDGMQPALPSRHFVRRHNFNGQRPSTIRRRQARGRPRAIDNRVFLRDLILLGGPDTVVVPRQGARLALMEQGHVITGGRFTRGMNAAQVELAIVEAFEGKIPAGVDFEILMSMHTALVAPSLAPGQDGIDGAILQRLFQTKPIYVRPSQHILSSHTPELEGVPQVKITEDESRVSGRCSQDLPNIFSDEDLIDLTIFQSELARNNGDQVETFPVVDVVTENPQVPPPDNADEVVLPALHEDEVIQFQEVVVHRSAIRDDVIKIFMDPNILNITSLEVIVINENGCPEPGKGSGVLRDILTHFWQDFFTAFSTGGSEKTPHIRHDLQKPEWESIARIIVYGYLKVSYFPVQLSQLFVICCLFGEESVDKEFLLGSFRGYIAADDRKVFDILLSKEFNPNDEDILDFLSMWNCHKIPTPANIESIIFELAHQELIQKTKYIANCWSVVLKSLQSKDSLFQTQKGIEELYESKQVTAKKVNKLFVVDPCNDAERQVIGFLKRYVKTLEGKALERFLHFVTGSNVIACESIEIIFTKLEGFQRRPVAHTCGPSLELPTTYDSFAELSEEFTSILRESMSWSFDII